MAEPETDNSKNKASQAPLNLTPLDKIVLQLVVGYFLENPMPKRVVFSVAEKLGQDLDDTSDMIKSLTDKLADGVQLDGALGPNKFPGEGKPMNKRRSDASVILKRVREGKNNEQSVTEIPVPALSLFEWQLMNFYANAVFPNSNRFAVAQALEAPFEKVKSSTWDLIHWGHLTVIEDPDHNKVLQIFVNSIVPPLSELTEVKSGIFRPADKWLNTSMSILQEEAKELTYPTIIRILINMKDKELLKLLNGLAEKKLSVVKFFVQAATEQGVFSDKNDELPYGREIYIRRENRKENIIEFINRVYADKLDGTFTRAQLRLVDDTASNALYNYERRHGRTPSDELNLPKKAERLVKNAAEFGQQEEEIAREILRVAGVVQRRRDKTVRIKRQQHAQIRR